MKRPPQQPKPNPAWRHSAPRAGVITLHDEDDKPIRVAVVEVDAMVLSTITEHYRAAGVPLIPAKG